MRIMTAGLGQAVAFLLAKAKNKKLNLKRLHEHLTDWVIKKRPMTAKKPGSLHEPASMDGPNGYVEPALAPLAPG